MIWIMIININIYFKSLITFCLVIIIEKLKIYFCDYNWILYKIFENVNISRLSGSLIRKLGSNYWKWHILNKKHHCLYFYKQWCFNFYLSNGFIVGTLFVVLSYSTKLVLILLNSPYSNYPPYFIFLLYFESLCGQMM